ncbi:MAG: hypothetical protein HC866_00885 [Leptolyngbyaceae cyanobacterium RU_5_1]|nr:hypothetical protein [Leptolyngbyaceae cyanobacterium RU_5_1]
MHEPFTIRFAQGSTAVGLQASDLMDVEEFIRKQGFQVPCPVIVVIGGAKGLQRYHIDKLRSLLVNVIAPVAETLNAVVIDGGTDTGIMRMMGTARQETRSTFPLIGVLPIGVATLPAAPPPSPAAAPLEPHHTHFILTPGYQWGDESPWIAAIASILSKGAPTVTVLINGGEVTWQDASESVRVGRPIVAVEDSGRAADALVSALNGQVTDERATGILASGLLKVASLGSDNGLADAIRKILVVN